MTWGRVIVIAAVVGVVTAGCGIGASDRVVTFPPESIGPDATVTPAVAQTAPGWLRAMAM